MFHWGKPDAWRRGCFLVIAVADARTIGYVIASGDELNDSPIRLTAVPVTDIQGKVVDESGTPIVGATVRVDLYLLVAKDQFAMPRCAFRAGYIQIPLRPSRRRTRTKRKVRVSICHCPRSVGRRGICLG